MNTPHTHTTDDDPRDLYTEVVLGALTAAVRGWHVFPLVPGDKRPAVTGWQDRATTDPDRIVRCWSTRTPHGPYGLGIACGPSGLLVVDLDTPKTDPATGRPVPLPAPWQQPGIRDGDDVLAVLAEQHRADVPLDTYTVRTPSGGTHLYFTAPDPTGDGGPLRNTAGTLGPLVDTRGSGGYVVAPPTRLPVRLPGLRAPRTRGYVADHPGALAVPLPGWLADLLTPKPVPPQRPVTVTLTAAGGDDRAAAYLRAAVDRTLSAVLAAPPGTRNRALYGAAVSLGQLVAGGALDETEARAALLAAGTTVGQTPRAAAATVTSGLRAGARRPRTLDPTATTPGTTNGTTNGRAA